MYYKGARGSMKLKPITLRLDEEEYEKLKKYLDEFGDPDINVAFIIRSYIRDLNRALPFMVTSGMDLKNYFGMLGSWLKQFGSMTDADVYSKMMNPWALWNMPGATPQKPAEAAEDPGQKKDGKSHRIKQRA
jgi:hypothetical protein